MVMNKFCRHGVAIVGLFVSVHVFVLEFRNDHEITDYTSWSSHQVRGLCIVFGTISLCCGGAPSDFGWRKKSYPLSTATIMICFKHV